MATTNIPARAYCSPSGVVLLAFYWKPPANKPFFGFSIKRTPGFYDTNSGLQLPFNWLPNRLNFHGPLDEDSPSSVAPIQKFMWWDARFHPKEDGGKKFVYDVIPITGSSDSLEPVPNVRGRVTVTFPAREEQGIGTWFNRPFVSSQAFSRLLQRFGVDTKSRLSDLSPEQREGILGWLSNDIQDAVFAVLKEKGNVDGAIYHFSDTQWLKPAFEKRSRTKTSVVLHWKPEGTTGHKTLANQDFEKKLRKNVTFFKRTKVPSLMHDKILVVSPSGKAQKVLMGSANFTTGALTSQANVLHIWSFPKLAQAYLDRVKLLQADPSKRQGLPAEWSQPINLKGGGSVRVFFPPEPGEKKTKGPGQSVVPISEAVKKAKSSVVFCLFSSTDDGVRNACLAAGKRGLMMYGLVNQISNNPPKNTPQNKAKVELFQHSKTSSDIVGAASLLSQVPEGWLREIFSFGVGDKAVAEGNGGKRSSVPEVHIHHKFVLIDGETDHPILYTGSANISSNSAYHNDENLLEIRGARALSAIYLAEFMRLYEHYRFRFLSDRDAKKKKAGTKKKVLRLDDTGRKWFKRFFMAGSPESRSTKRLAGG